jgi:hypothetical protein
MNEQARFGLREKIAITLSAGILLGSVVYWLLQIVDVVETLKMAYGG